MNFFNFKDKYTVITDIIILLTALIIAIFLINDYRDIKKATRDHEQVRYVRAVDVKKDIIIGNPSAKIFIVEYGDLECPYCREFYPIGKKFIQSDWGVSGQVALVWRNSPHINTTSIEKAKTLSCIRHYKKEDKNITSFNFIEKSLVGGVGENTYPYERYEEIIEKLGLNANIIETCRKENELVEETNLMLKDVLELEITQTPFFQFVSDRGELLYEKKGVVDLVELEFIVSNLLSGN